MRSKVPLVVAVLLGSSAFDGHPMLGHGRSAAEKRAAVVGTFGTIPGMTPMPRLLPPPAA
jgi:hypothetical protein